MLINQDSLIAQLKKESFDAGISEPFNFCGFGRKFLISIENPGLMEHLGIKTTIGAFSTFNLNTISYNIGEPMAYSYVPFTTETDKMGIFGKLDNLIGGAMISWVFDLFGTEEGIHLRKKYGVSYSGYEVSFLHQMMKHKYINTA